MLTMIVMIPSEELDQPVPERIVGHDRRDQQQKARDDVDGARDPGEDGDEGDASGTCSGHGGTSLIGCGFATR